jgi:hypothetical protein
VTHKKRRNLETLRHDLHGRIVVCPDYAERLTNAISGCEQLRSERPGYALIVPARRRQNEMLLVRVY